MKRKKQSKQMATQSEKQLELMPEKPVLDLAFMNRLRYLTGGIGSYKDLDGALCELGGLNKKLLDAIDLKQRSILHIEQKFDEAIDVVVHGKATLNELVESYARQTDFKGFTRTEDRTAEEITYTKQLPHGKLIFYVKTSMKMRLSFTEEK